MDWTKFSAIATAIYTILMLGIVGFTGWQVLILRRQNQAQFEDSLAREYRELMNKIPIKVWLGENLTAKEYKENLHNFYYYFHLSNQQILYFQRGRIKKEIWRNIVLGIKGNLELPAFAKAWEEIESKSQKTRFGYLKQLIESDFDNKRSNFVDPSKMNLVEGYKAVAKEESDLAKKNK